MNELKLEERVIARQLRRTAELSPEAPFLQFQDHIVSYDAFHRRTNSIANSLATCGLQIHSKIAIFARNSLEFIEGWFSAAKIGAIYVPINTEYKGEILRYQLHNADVTHIVIDPEFLDRLAAVITELPKLKHVILTHAAQVPDSLKLFTTVHILSQFYSASERDPGIEIAFDHPHAISFTSGTTGPSKGVLCLNAHVATFALDWMRVLAFQKHEAIYTPLPLFHAIGAWLGVVPAMLNGTRIAISQRFSASTYWDDVRQAKADITHGIFSMIPILLKQPERADDANQPARAYYIGNQNPAFEERFNCRIIEVYGATETGIVSAFDYEGQRRPKSCGKPNSETFEVVALNEFDQPVPPGTVGEIAVRPRNPFSMIKEYYAKPMETAEAFRNLWFHTGDNGRFDEDGYLYFVDRKKDAIRRRGENISSYELEFAVNKHPDVLECAAVAVTSELGEDEVKVAVVLQEGSNLTVQELWAFCEETMPRFWLPSQIELHKELPKTANHKIQKFLLRERSAGVPLYARDWKTGEIREI